MLGTPVLVVFFKRPVARPESSFPFNPLTVRRFDPLVDPSPEISEAVGGDPPRTIPVKAPDEERTVGDEKYGRPPLVPERLMLSVPEAVTGDPVTAKMPDDDPLLMVSPTLVTVPLPPGKVCPDAKVRIPCLSTDSPVSVISPVTPHSKLSVAPVFVELFPIGSACH
jgi:hypothetical protein